MDILNDDDQTGSRRFAFYPVGLDSLFSNCLPNTPFGEFPGCKSATNELEESAEKL
ncbi:hypothetical protein GO755_22645 [Spirosoma sp. HMF4905]|uniref:Uncharacterized protein n=1 Tax=Spirosoma arboris TaxID=2682092 RepID=A0A7K1SGY6_9BACT|nr:hypothetical protein [Spirosoma arboris]MVM32856.1 hypothetical protein [Spirosoma arboris]